MAEFAAGALFGICMTVTLLLVFILIFGREDEGRDDDDDWDPWGGRRA